MREDSHVTNGRKGGKATYARHRDEALARLHAAATFETRQKGGLKASEDRTPWEYMCAGSKGGETTKKRYGREHFREIGRKGGLARKAKLEAQRASMGNDAS